MNPGALLSTSLLGACVLLNGCSLLPFHDWPGPTVANQLVTDVDWEAKLTDGTVRRGTHRPCAVFGFFDPQPVGHSRRVFVERLTFWKDGAIIGEYEGAEVEALGADGGTAALDEIGLRRITEGSCFRVFNTLDRDVYLNARYADGSTASLTLRPCQTHLWTGLDPIRNRRTEEDDTVPTRLTISDAGGVIQDFDESAIRKTVKRRLAPVYAIRGSGFVGANAPPKQCLQPQSGAASTAT